MTAATASFTPIAVLFGCAPIGRIPGATRVRIGADPSPGPGDRGRLRAVIGIGDRPGADRRSSGGPPSCGLPVAMGAIAFGFRAVGVDIALGGGCGTGEGVAGSRPSGAPPALDPGRLEVFAFVAAMSVAMLDRPRATPAPETK